MNITHEDAVTCAKAVLKAYHIHPSVSNQFRKGSKNHRLFYSERASKSFPAILYFLDNVEEYAQKATEVAHRANGLPFHAILTHTDYGDLLDVLYVPYETEALASFLKDAREGYFRSYCYNLTEGFSEIGYIKVKPSMGGLERIG